MLHFPSLSRFIPSYRSFKNDDEKEISPFPFQLGEGPARVQQVPSTAPAYATINKGKGVESKLASDQNGSHQAWKPNIKQVSFSSEEDLSDEDYETDDEEIKNSPSVFQIRRTGQGEMKDDSSSISSDEGDSSEEDDIDAVWKDVDSEDEAEEKVDYQQQIDQLKSFCENHREEQAKALEDSPEATGYFNKANEYAAKAIAAYQNGNTANGKEWETAARLTFYGASEIGKMALPDWSKLSTSDFINKIKQEHNVNLTEYASPIVLGLVRPIARKAILSFTSKMTQQELEPAYTAIRKARAIEDHLKIIDGQSKITGN